MNLPGRLPVVLGALALASAAACSAILGDFNVGPGGAVDGGGATGGGGTGGSGGSAGGGGGGGAGGSADAGPDAMTGDFSVSVPPNVFVKPGGATDLSVTINRLGSSTGAVTVTVTGLPHAVSVAPLTIAPPPASQVGALHLTAQPDANVGVTASLVVTGGGDGTTHAASTKLLIAGETGTLDPKFPPVAAPAVIKQLHAALSDADGRAILIGRFTTSGAVPAVAARLTIDGALDPGFALTAPPMSTTSALGVAATLDPTGRLLVVFLDGAHYKVVRYDGAGALDQGFGNGGVQSIAWIPRRTDEIVPSVAVDGAGAVIVMNAVDPGSGNGELFLTKLTPTGLPDPSVGTTGNEGNTVIPPSGGTTVLSITSAHTLFAAPSGLYFVVEGAVGSGFSGSAIGRLAPNLSLDTTFAQSGWHLAAKNQYRVVAPIGADLFFAKNALGAVREPWFVEHDVLSATSFTSGQASVIGTALGATSTGGATAIAPGPAGSILTAGPSAVPSVGVAVVVARLLTTPGLTLDVTWNKSGGSLLPAIPSVDQTPLQIFATTDGFTILVTRDIQHPLHRFWP